MRHIACALVTIVVLSMVQIPPPAAAAARVVLTPPVAAPVLDPFRLPAGPYGPGNRGIEYDTAGGEAVTAAAGGVVIFAGAVAGTLHVTIAHGGGMVSSYSFLARVLVGRGDVVERGDRVGLAGAPFHFGVRIDGAYVDPASLMGVMLIHVRLVANRGRALGLMGPFDTSAVDRAEPPSAWAPARLAPRVGRAWRWYRPRAA